MRRTYPKQSLEPNKEVKAIRANSNYDFEPVPVNILKSQAVKERKALAVVMIYFRFETPHGASCCCCCTYLLPSIEYMSELPVEI
jgi:hypothetical protein